MARVRMSREDRAKQFVPFDALKGFQELLRLKEYEHDRSEKGDLTEEKIDEISRKLLTIKKNDMVEATYFVDGYYKTILGKANVNLALQKLKINSTIINFSDIFNIELL